MSAHNIAGVTILVVDDQAANLQLLGELLSREGYDVLPALDGQQALQRAQARLPDLVLLDMMMPGMNGFELADALHARPDLADVPIIFLTAATDRESLVRAFAAGAVDFITKPFVSEELLARVRTHIELKRARDRMRALLREREELTNVVAHDLKNPLSNIRFAAQLLQRRNDLPASASGLIDDVLLSSQESLAFIQRYLSRRADGERVQPQSETIELGQLALQALARQRAAAQAHGITLKLDVREPASAHADRVAVRNVIENFLSNAIRHSPEGDEVLVTIGRNRSGFSECLVMDRGPGVPENEQHKLFQRFARIATAQRSAEYSSGLGLAIAKHDITQLGGHLWYEARAGGGSVFGFELPQAAPERSAD